MAREIDLIGYLPDIMQEIREFQQIIGAENPELSLLFEKLDLVIDNCFVDSLDSYGCSRWENMLAIIPKDTDSIELRRIRIKAALNGDTPYTMRSLENKLIALCGENNVFVEYANDIFTLSVSIALQAKDQYIYIKNVLEEIVPANIIINVKLLYNTHSVIKKMTHAEMKAFTHKSLREEVL